MKKLLNKQSQAYKIKSLNAFGPSIKNKKIIKNLPKGFYLQRIWPIPNENKLGHHKI